MRSVKLLIFLLLFSFALHAQKTLTGLWTGTMSNDSTAIRRDQSVEIALSQYKQKVTGYSRATFVINDSLYFIVKRVKGTIDGNICEVTDDEIISHNFPVKPEKKVRLIFTFHFNPADSNWRMDGNWKTTKTKEYYSISGKTELKEEKNYEQSKIFPHLEELKLADEVAFYKEAKQNLQQVVVNVKKDKAALIADNKPAPVEEKKTVVALKENKAEEAKPVTTLNNQSKEEKKKQEEALVSNVKPVDDIDPVQQTKAEKKEAQPVSVKQDAVVVVKTDNRNNIPALKPESQQQNTSIAINNTEKDNKPVNPVTTAKQEPVAIAKTENKQQTTTEKPKQPEIVNDKKGSTNVANPLSAKSESVVVKTEEKKPVITETPKQKPVENKEVAIIKPSEEKKNTETTITKPATVAEIPKAENITAAVEVKERKTIANQVVTFKSDSLQLALYDNGEVDGDTVSVLLNGEIIIAKQGLKTTAVRKTIYIHPGDDEITMVLYAENLGKYPPNTGLLMIYDGDDRYQVRFSADLQQNAGIVFKRKK